MQTTLAEIGGMGIQFARARVFFQVQTGAGALWRMSTASHVGSA